MAEDSRKLFVAGLPDSITEDVLRQLFEATGGNVVEVSLPKDRATGRPRGFGFVTLSTTQEASAARESLDGSYQGGKSISVRPFQAEPPRRDGVRPAGASVAAASTGPGGPAAAPDRTLYVGNLPYDASVEEIEALIGSTGAGPVVRVHLPMDPDGRKRGFGFVTMASAEAAKTAIDALRGVDVRGRRLVVNLAHPKGEQPPRGDERTASFGGSGGAPGGYSGSSGSYGGGSAGGGGSSAGGPPPQRKTFDERPRRRGGGGGGHDGEGPPGGGGRRNKQAWSRDRDDDWGDE
jgi:RNA recognition motif-containing protein